MATTPEQFHNRGRDIVTDLARAMDDFRAWSRVFEVRGGAVGLDAADPEGAYGIPTEGLVVLSMGTQNYEFATNSTAIGLSGKTAATAGDFRLHSNDGDGTDDTSFSVFGVGTTAAVTNRERLQLFWNSAGSTYDIRSEANGTGTLRPLTIYTEGNTSQIHLLTNGKVGFGTTTVGGTRLGVKAGTSSNDAAIGGVLYSTITTVGNVGTGEDNLTTYTVPANALSANGMSFTFSAVVEFAGAGTQILRVRFGTAGTTLIGSYTTSGAGEKAIIEGRVIRVSATSQIGYVVINTTGGAISRGVELALNQTLSNAIDIRITGDATSNNDMVGRFLNVEYKDINT